MSLPSSIVSDPACQLNWENVDPRIEALVARAAALEAVRPTLVTALPGSPVDGQQVFYQPTAPFDGSNSMASLGRIWHLRYRAASASAYKWEALAAAPLAVYDAAQVSTTATTPTTGQVGTNLTVPLAGDYEVVVGARLGISGDTTNALLTISVNS